MIVDPLTAIDRAIHLLPGGEQRDRIIAALLDDAGENGCWPRYSDLHSVRQVLNRGAHDIAAVTGLPLHDAEWLVKNLRGGVSDLSDLSDLPIAAPAKRKGGWPKGRPRNARARQPEA